MRCRAFEEPIARYVGGDLTPDEAVAVMHHLRTCPDCAELARELEEDRQWLSLRPSESAEVDYIAMRRRIHEEISQAPLWRKWLPALLAAAAILLTVGIATIRRAHHPVRSIVPTAIAQTVLPPAAAPPVRAAVVHRPRRAKRVRATDAPTTDLTLEAAIRMFQELNPEPPPEPLGSDPPVEVQMATRDPKVTIILVQENNGDSK